MTDQHLPRVIEVLEVIDCGPGPSASCPHCGADGRYITRFRCDDGTTRGAMSGCFKLFLPRERLRRVGQRAEPLRAARRVAGRDAGLRRARDRRRGRPARIRGPARRGALHARDLALSRRRGVALRRLRPAADRPPVGLAGVRFQALPRARGRALRGRAARGRGHDHPPRRSRGASGGQRRSPAARRPASEQRDPASAAGESTRFRRAGAAPGASSCRASPPGRSSGPATWPGTAWPPTACAGSLSCSPTSTTPGSGRTARSTSAAGARARPIARSASCSAAACPTTP